MAERRYLESCLLTTDPDEIGRPERGTVAGVRAHLADVRRCLDDLRCYVHDRKDCTEMADYAHLVASNRLADLEFDVDTLAEGKPEKRRKAPVREPKGVVLDIPIGEDGAS